MSREEGPYHVLLVDQEPQVGDLITRTLGGEKVVLHLADSIEQANQLIETSPIDLALIEPRLRDGSGIELAEHIRRQRPIAQTIVITGEPSLENAIEAIRAGVGDFISKPLDLDDLNRRVKLALDRHCVDRHQIRRMKRLERVCKKLNSAHEDVTRQVDILCNDLVTAYQELANQFSQVSETRGYSQMIENELDLELILRKTLEHLLAKFGPTNGAIFLPTMADEYTLGGYVNYDCSAESADVLLEHLANVVAPRVSGKDKPLHITDNEVMADLIGDDWNYLADSHAVVVPARHEGECLAVLIVFRDGSEPFTGSMVSYLGSMAPILAKYLAKVIRIHHRHTMKDDDGLAAGF